MTCYNDEQCEWIRDEHVCGNVEEEDYYCYWIAGEVKCKVVGKG
jgi:hypothetical protein